MPLEASEKDAVLAALNRLLAIELGAINQYMVHAEICENSGHDRLAQAYEARNAEEMKHVQRLVARIRARGGKPGLGTASVDGIAEEDLGALLRADLRTEELVVAAYQDALSIASEDRESRELLASILEEERRHVAWLRDELGRLERTLAEP